jgi:hypothetical protein
MLDGTLLEIVEHLIAGKMASARRFPTLQDPAQESCCPLKPKSLEGLEDFLQRAAAAPVSPFVI